jgi:TPR repeat protein
MLSARRLVLPALVGLGVVLSGCGGNASAAGSATDPVEAVQGYMKAVEGGSKEGGLEFLQTDINDGIALKSSTSASRWMADHKAATWKVVDVNYADPGTDAAKPTKKACQIGQPAPGQLCVVTVQVDGGGAPKPVWFHFAVESRYPVGVWKIVQVDMVDTKPDDLLPTGNEAHKP